MKIKKQTYLHFFLLGMILFLGLQCAQLAPPQGGPKDQRPPVLIEELSTPNFQTNFEIQQIDLYFDEYVDVRDVFKQVVVSPPLDNLPKVTARLKHVKFEFPEGQELKENATYTINFGNSIRDFTEGNKLTDFRFVFSTGDYIDSLELSGTVVNAFDGTPSKEVLVMLYDQFRDSVVYEEKPFYFSTTDNNGKFKFENLRSDSFKIFALQDANLNYLFDSEGESIGFLEDKIYITDTSTAEIKMELFQPIAPLKIQSSKVDDYGIAYFLFNRNPEWVKLEWKDTMDYTYHRTNKDSLIVYYNTDLSNPFDLILSEDGSIVDTINFPGTGKSVFLNNNKQQIFNYTVKRSQKLQQNKSMEVFFNHPIAAITDDLLELKDTSSTKRPVVGTIDSLNPLKVVLSFEKRKGEELEMTFLPGAFEDMFGMVNDTLNFSFKISDPVLYGILNVQLDSLNQNLDYIVHLYEGKNLVTSRYISRLNSQKLTFNNLEPKEYSVEIIEDRNGNRRWDPGDYGQKLQSERIMRKKFAQLKGDWEMNETISWNPNSK